MSQKSAADKCLTWIADEKYVQETSDCGSTAGSVESALEDQRRRVKLIGDYQRNTSKVAASSKDEKEKAALKTAHSNLTDVANQRLGCLQGISQITELEAVFGKLSVDFADKAIQLVNQLSVCGDTDVTAGDTSDSSAIVAQNCILSVRSNWSWVATLAKCADVHLQHVSAYHQFYHEIKEYGRWMPAELQTAQDRCDAAAYSNKTELTGARLLDTIKDLFSVYESWQARVDRLLERGKGVVPVHLRTSKPDRNRPVQSLCNYRAKEVNVREGEEMVLLDNSTQQSWQVRNMHSATWTVPSIILVIPGPDTAAIQAATRLRLQLLGSWTISLKQFGKTMISRMLTVFREWTPTEKDMLRAMGDSDKQTLLRAMSYIESTLLQYWSEYVEFKTLQQRMKATKTILQEKGKRANADDKASKTLVKSSCELEELLQRYQEFWSSWETYRLLMETANQPEFLLLLERWEQLKLIEILPLLKWWHSGGGDLLDGLSRAAESATARTAAAAAEEETLRLEEAKASMLGSAAAMTINGTERGISTRQETKSSQHTTIEQQENKTFVITGVLDPRSGDEVSMQQAVMLGIIDSKNGLYVNPETGEKMPIPTAMAAGKIMVEFTQTKKTAETRRDIGLITIRTLSESRPYTVKQVIDAQTGEKLSVEEAIASGVLDKENGIVRNRATGGEMTVGDALSSGLLVVEFDKSAPAAHAESVEVTYAIHSVVDALKREKVSFSVAVRLGLIDTKTGAFNNNKTGETLYVGDAIKRGFIKATVVKDPSTMDIDTENKVFIDKVSVIKNKLLAPIKAISAMKKAVEHGKQAAESAAAAESTPAEGTPAESTPAAAAAAASPAAGTGDNKS